MANDLTCGKSGTKTACNKCNKCKTKVQLDEHLLLKRTQQIEADVQKIKESKQGQAGNIFSMKKNIAGPKKGSQEASAIRDPETGELLVNKEEIKRATLAYCVNNLKNFAPQEDMKTVVKTRKKEQLKIMNDKTGERFALAFQAGTTENVSLSLS